MSNALDLNTIVWRSKVKHHILGATIGQIIGALLVLIALYDYNKLPSKVDDDVKDMLLAHFLYEIPLNIILASIIHFVLIKFKNKTAYKVFAILLIVTAIVHVLFNFLGPPDKKYRQKRDKYYKSKIKLDFNFRIIINSVGKIAKKTIAWGIPLFRAVLGVTLLFFVFGNQAPPPPPTVVVKRPKNQKTKEEDEESGPE